jgi:hypothetical protein
MRGKGGKKRGFSSRNLKEGAHLVDKFRWWDNNKMDLKKPVLERMDWINLAPNRDQWRAALNSAMALKFL